MSNFQRRNNGVYSLRLRFPADLAHWFPDKSELRKSLRTKKRKCAKMTLTKHLEPAERTLFTYSKLSSASQ